MSPMAWAAPAVVKGSARVVLGWGDVTTVVAQALIGADIGHEEAEREDRQDEAGEGLDRLYAVGDQEEERQSDEEWR